MVGRVAAAIVFFLFASTNDYSPLYQLQSVHYHPHAQERESNNKDHITYSLPDTLGLSNSHTALTDPRTT